MDDNRSTLMALKETRAPAIAAIQEQLEALPADQREAIEARFFEGSCIDSIATTLDKTTGAIRGLLHRAKQTFKSAMGNSSR